MVFSKVVKVVFLSMLALLPASAFAGSEAVTLQATGTIAAAPAWQDGAGADLTNIAFSFASLIAGSASAADVDSAAFVAKLVNATAYPATVALLRPAGCAIGANSVTDSNVHFVNNGTAISSNANISISSNGNQSFALRFASAGGHGSQSGSVSCTTPGSLTYSY